ncbi:hypothetical protein sce2111 [Sorangium cellulosum So ce56]|uniref:Uncharacterized protein n=1 Tax=Sorangium cellulosum (strain So ce56) TaxID=448385 RepID=A9FVF6_SORC5|nr:hypothetical protein [Sorangium cellulosum]CAN92270.1 hypothetical protein sce2111 [Sorangium cellulosum So ce56]
MDQANATARRANDVCVVVLSCVMDEATVRMLWDEGQAAEAIAGARAALVGAPEDARLSVAGALIACADAADSSPMAEEAHRVAAELRESVWGSDHPRSPYVRLPLAGWLQRVGRFDEAERELLAALAVAERRTEDPRPLRDVLVCLARLALERNDLDEAAVRFQCAMAAEESRPRPEAIELQPLLGELHAIYAQQGRVAEAASAMERRLQLSRTLGRRPSLDDARDLLALADLRDKQGRSGDAAALRERSARISRAAGRR